MPRLIMIKLEIILMVVNILKLLNLCPSIKKILKINTSNNNDLDLSKSTRY
jgi:hypothetical protein